MINKQRAFYYVFEGTSCAGKTALLNEMSSRGYPVIPETIRFRDDFPPLPTNYSESRRNEKIIIEIEKERCDMAYRYGREAGYVFADRMLASTMSISYAWNYGTMSELIGDIKDYIYYQKSNFLSDLNIYLKADIDKVLERNLLRPRPLNERWVSKEVLTAQMHFYELYMRCIKSDHWQVVDTNRMTTQQIAEEILRLEYIGKEVSKEERISEFEDLLKSL